MYTLTITNVKNSQYRVTEENGAVFFGRFSAYALYINAFFMLFREPSVYFNFNSAIIIPGTKDICLLVERC